MSRYTDGPWRVAQHMIVAGDRGVHVAKVCTTGMGHAVKHNARLIAMAPRLLDVLRMALPHVRSCADADLYFAQRASENGMHGTEAELRKQHEMRLSAVQVIEQTIAKAEGRDA